MINVFVKIAKFYGKTITCDEHIRRNGDNTATDEDRVRASVLWVKSSVLWIKSSVLWVRSGVLWVGSRVLWVGQVDISFQVAKPPVACRRKCLRCFIARPTFVSSLRRSQAVSQNLTISKRYPR